MYKELFNSIARQLLIWYPKHKMWPRNRQRVYILNWRNGQASSRPVQFWAGNTHTTRRMVPNRCVQASDAEQAFRRPPSPMFWKASPVPHFPVRRTQFPYPRHLLFYNTWQPPPLLLVLIFPEKPSSLAPCFLLWLPVKRPLTRGWPHPQAWQTLPWDSERWLQHSRMTRSEADLTCPDYRGQELSLFRFVLYFFQSRFLTLSWLLALLREGILAFL